MNEKVIVEEYEFDKPLIHKLVSINDNCIRDCHNKNFHTFEYKCEHDIKLTNIANNEPVNLKIVDKSRNFYEKKNKKLRVARQNGFIFNQIPKLTIKIYSNLSHINIQYHLNHQLPVIHRHSFKILS